MAILEPNTYVRRDYLTYVAETLDGEPLIGCLRNENEVTITLQQVNGGAVVLRRTDIQYLQAQPWSPTPERMEEGLTPRTWPTCWNTSFCRQPLPKPLLVHLIRVLCALSRLTPREALARLPPLPCGEPAGDSGDLDDRLGGGLAAVTPQTAHHPELCRSEEQDRQRASPNSQFQNPPRLMIRSHAATLVQEAAGALIDKLCRNIGLTDGRIGSRRLVNFRRPIGRHRNSKPNGFGIWRHWARLETVHYTMAPHLLLCWSAAHANSTFSFRPKAKAARSKR